MERLRFDPYAPASANYSARHIGYSADRYRDASQRTPESCPCNDVSPAATVNPQTGLARAFLIPQESIYPQFELCEGWRKGSIFVALEKPLEGVNRCGRK